MASERTLDRERDGYTKRIAAALLAARLPSRALRAVGDDEDIPEPTRYGPVDWDVIYGSADDRTREWIDGLGPDWLDGWERGAAAALDGAGVGGIVPMPPRGPSVLARLEVSAAQVADYSRERVTAIVQEGLDQGRPIHEITWSLRQDQGFNAARGLRIARTETVRSQSAGELDRYGEAAAVGLDLEQTWVTALDGAVRHSHQAMEGQTVPISGVFVFPSGVETPGPGLSGDPSEDINCRCSRYVAEAGTRARELAAAGKAP